MKKRVLIDARMVGPVGHGIGLYVRQMAEGLARIEKPYEPFYLVAPDCPKDSPLRRESHAECTVPFLAPAELWSLGKEIRRHRPDLYHTPSFASLLSYPCPVVQTVHDLNHLHFGGVTKKIYYHHLLLPSMARARALLTVSQTAAHEIRAFLAKNGVTRELEVVGNAIEEFPRGDDAQILARLGLQPGDYFLTLANPKPHKNLALLTHAYAAARAERELPPLVLTTPGTSRYGVIHTGPLADSEIGALLRHAKCFYWPSLYEGFGRPPLEAALAGTIPVASALAVHEEVLAGVKETIFLDPANEPLWKESFLRMANVSDRVSAESQAWIRNTWSVAKLAESMDRIYRRCLG